MDILANLWKLKETGASTLNGVTDAERKRAIFLSVIGPRTYKLLSSLVAPSKPGEKTYDELVVALTEHHSPAPSEIVQRFMFMQLAVPTCWRVGCYLCSGVALDSADV